MCQPQHAVRHFGRSPAFQKLITDDFQVCIILIGHDDIVVLAIAHTRHASGDIRVSRFLFRIGYSDLYSFRGCFPVVIVQAHIMNGAFTGKAGGDPQRPFQTCAIITTSCTRGGREGRVRIGIDQRGQLVGQFFAFLTFWCRECITPPPHAGINNPVTGDRSGQIHGRSRCLSGAVPLSNGIQFSIRIDGDKFRHHQGNHGAAPPEFCCLRRTGDPDRNIQNTGTVHGILFHSRLTKQQHTLTLCRSAGDSHGVIKLNLNQRYTAVITDPVKINHCGFSLSDAGWATGFSVAVVASADTAGASSAAFSA
ncbi:hypothetical protein BvCmsNSP006_05798 [Escherichia coli]|nr:hypothetical protein BvCmsKSP014_05223 [Escherichia coli]GDP55514.1 hypothetical protein BvCmsNSP006_05798 [Escherichia coli]